MRLVVAFLLLGTVARADNPALALKSEVEDGKKMLIATVTRDGKPMEGVSVSFVVERSFGTLLIGEDKTLGDGTAAVPAPEGLPSGPSGELKIIARATLPDTTQGETQASTDVAQSAPPSEPIASPAATPAQIIDAQFTLKGDVKMLREQEPVPRALWAPRAPVPLLATVTAILVVVWGSYAFIVSQLIKIKQEARK